MFLGDVACLRKFRAGRNVVGVAVQYSCGPKISSTDSAVGRSDNSWIRS